VARLRAGQHENRGSIAGRGRKLSLLSTASGSAVVPTTFLSTGYLGLLGHPKLLFLQARVLNLFVYSRTIALHISAVNSSSGPFTDSLKRDFNILVTFVTNRIIKQIVKLSTARLNISVHALCGSSHDTVGISGYIYSAK
jgi:hypothetical protein